MSGALMTITRSQSVQFDISLTGEAAQMKDDALSMLALISRIESAEDNETATLAMRDAKALLANVEKAREEAKRPFLEAGRKIDAAAKAFAESINRELMRCSKLAGDYAELQLAQQRAAEAARRLEEERIAKEREAELRRVEEERLAKERAIADQERQARIAAEQAKSKKAKEEAARLADEARRQRELADAETFEKREQIDSAFCQRTADLPIVESPAMADGQSIKEEPVIDEIRELELMRMRPDLVRKVEFDRVRIKDELSRGVKIAGIKWHMETKVVVRASRSPVLEIGGAR